MSDTNIFNTPLTNSTPSEQIALDCTALQGLCELPLGNELLDAKFTREGHDLLVTAPSKLVVAENYFTHETAPTLISDTGKKIAGTSVNTLIEAEAPKEYAGPVSSEPSIGIVEKLAGTVTVKRGGADIELKQGDQVFQNDVIQTADNSKIGITFEDGSVFTLGSDARMTLDSFVYDAETGDGSSSINVIKGMFKFVSGEIAANNPGEMQVETPVATIGIRGTTGGGSVQGEGLENDFFLEPNADGTVGWFDVITDQGTTSMNQPNTVVQVTSFNEAPSAPAFSESNQIQQDFQDVMSFAPEGKYDVRENSSLEQKEENPETEANQAVEAEVTPEAQAVEKSAEEVETEETATEEVTAAQAEENTSAETTDTIKTTLNGEADLSAFEEAQNIIEGNVEALAENNTNEAEKQAELLASVTGNLEGAADTAEATIEEIVEETRDELVESVLITQAGPTLEAPVITEEPPVNDEPTVTADPVTTAPEAEVEEEVETVSAPLPATNNQTLTFDDLTATYNLTLDGYTNSTVEGSVSSSNLTLSIENSTNIDATSIGTGGNISTTIEGSNNVSVAGSDGNNLFFLGGTGGTIELNGGAGNDFFELMGSQSNVTIDGGAGFNQYHLLSSGDDITVTDGAASSTFLISGDATNIRIDGSGGSDLYKLDNFSGSAYINSSPGDEIRIETALQPEATVELEGQGSIIQDAGVNYGITEPTLALSGNDLVITFGAAGNAPIIAIKNITNPSTNFTLQQEGTDTINFDGESIDVLYDIRDLTLPEYQSASTLTAITSNNVNGSVLEDTITVDTSPNQIIQTFDGNDTVFVNAIAAGNENYDIKLGGGNDTVILQSHSIDTVSIDGGSGFDILDLSNVVPTGGVTLDLVNGTATYSSGTIISSLDGIEGYITGNQDDNITGNAMDEFLSAGAGDDSIFGGDGNDRLYGGNGNDTLDGGEDDDFIFGGTGNDILDSGNSGDDTLYGGAGNDVIYAGTQGIIDAGVDDDIIKLNTSSYNQYAIDGGSGSDTIDFIGGGAGTYDLSLLDALGIETLNSTSTDATFINFTADNIFALSGDTTLIVEGDAGDTIAGLSTENWINTTTAGGYTTYQNTTTDGNTVLVQINDAIST